MSYPVSACCFIKDCFIGAFALFESLASLLPFVEEAIVMDLGSTDGTLERLREIASHNSRVKLITGSFTYTDAGVFATLANDLVALCQNDNVLYWQSDEIWHENLLTLMKERFEAGQFDLSFWRIQYANNFQYVKWFPHLVHRVGQKGRFNFVGDGMNTDRTWDAKICSTYGGEMFPLWGELGQDGIRPYTREMITDISLLGGFRDNIVERRALHAPFWHEGPVVPYHYKETGQQIQRPASAWLEEALRDPDWTRTESPFDLPAILRGHIGKVRYELRPELFEALKQDRTQEFLEELTGQWK